MGKNTFFDGEVVACRPTGPKNAFVPFAADQVEGSVAQRFELMVREHPDNPAVSFEGMETTFAELNRRANIIASAILKRRGQRREPAALLLEKGDTMMAAVYGALKAARAIVPLDSAFPRARLSYMVENSTAPLLLVDESNGSLAREIAPRGVDIINVDDPPGGLREVNPGVVVPGDAYAWILYTSGSTGKPKGVYMTNRALLHSMMRGINNLRFSANDRITLLGSFAFSGSQSGYLGSILAGGCTAIYDVKKRGVTGLLDWIESERITVFISVPTLFRQFAPTLSPSADLSSLRLMRLMGEELTARDYAIFKKYFPKRCLFSNGYGATETGFTLQCYFDHGEQARGIMPAGFALPGCGVLILDEDGNELPERAIGQIAIEGHFLADGYWNNAAATAKSFHDSPDGDGARVYLTGDMGARLPGGYFVALGREDFQAKIRGSRVEAGEVESALAQVPGVANAAVVARKDHFGDDYLVAYIVPEKDVQPTVSFIRRHLTETLLDYMIPSRYVMLDSLPVSATGKLDRHSLGEPSRQRPRLDSPPEPPKTPMERLVSQVFGEVLSIDEVGVSDDFFDLGGHSVAAARVSARLGEVVGVVLGLESFLASPTAAGLALSLTEELTRRGMAGAGALGDVADEAASGKVQSGGARDE